MLFMYLYYLYLTLPWLICTTQDWCLNRQSDMWQHIITCLFIWNVQLHAFVSVCSYILLKYVVAYLKYAAACLKHAATYILPPDCKDKMKHVPDAFKCISVLLLMTKKSNGNMQLDALCMLILILIHFFVNSRF